MSKPRMIAIEIYQAAKRHGFKLEIRNEIRNDIRNDILTITKSFTPGSHSELIICENTYYDVIGLLDRTKTGSDWGNGSSAINSGRFVMNRSGGRIEVLRALSKLMSSDGIE
jgi:hypothetical protein